MVVTLVSNIPHYNYTAEALEEGGLLAHYCASWTLVGQERPPALLPPVYRRKLEGRRLTGVPSDRFTRLLLPEFLQKSLPGTRLVSAAAATDLNNWLFDARARRFAASSPVLHFVNTIGVACTEAARASGRFIVCDSRQEHPLAQDAILAREAEKRDVPAPRLHRRLTARMLQEFSRTDHFIVPSTYARRTFVENGIDPGRISVVPYGVEPTLFAPGAKTRGGPFTILFVGTLGLRKGVLYLLEAVRRLRSRSVDVVCIGNIEPGFERLLEPYRNLFRHIPNVPKVLLREHYGQADIFVLPSLTDAYPLVVLEAVSSGLPVVTTTNTGSCDILEHGRNGFIVEPCDADALAEAIARLRDSEPLRTDIAESNLRLRSHITWHSYKRRLLACYHSAILPQATPTHYAPTATA